MKKILNWWKKKNNKDKIIFILILILSFIFLSWKNLIPYKITTISSNGDKWSSWYWLGKEMKSNVRY